MSGSTQPATTTPPDDTVSIVIGNLSITGWQDVKIQRGIEQCPATFEMMVTERYPTDPDYVPILPGSPCTVMIGSDVAITGYVDRYSPSISARSHSVMVEGRSKCEDLVDCSALVQNSQVGQGTPSSLASKLAAPFGITVAGNITTPELPPFSITLGETPFEIIEKVARYAACLVYDTPDGNLLMAPVGTAQHSSGFQEGVNVQSASTSFSMDERYSEYTAVLFSTQTLNEMGNSGNLLSTVNDPGVTRFRPLIIVGEQFILGQSLAEQRATWEMRRRYGRSQSITVVCDSWRDSDGMLWTPNVLAPVSMPSLKVPSAIWIIASVSFEKSQDSGTQATITLMPPEAFTVEPSELQAYDVQLQQALSGQQ